ncbi:uncharacterized protein KZ484_017263 [Pholidichthys leucotaenia]
MAAGLVFLLCAAAVICCVGAQESYDDLPRHHQLGVDLALQKLRSEARVRHHFRFLRTLSKSEIEGGFGARFPYHHFYLKPTTCPKETTASDPQTCPFRNDRPLIDCAVCYKTVGDQIESNPKPYVHCIQKPRLTEDMNTIRADHCKKMRYNSGAPTLLAVSTG